MFHILLQLEFLLYKATWVRVPCVLIVHAVSHMPCGPQKKVLRGPTKIPERPTTGPRLTVSRPLVWSHLPCREFLEIFSQVS